METKKEKIVSAVATIGIILMLFGATYAYFASRVDAGKITDVEITANTVDVFSFETGDPITLSLDQESFAEGTGNKTGSTFAKAKLSANNKTNTATEHYYLFLNIESNSFIYSKDSDHPEILVKITDSDGKELVDSDIDGLTHKTVVDAKGNTVTGFDVTTKTGMITILNNREITTTSTKSETWTFTFTFVNYDFNQVDNAGKSFKANVMIQKELLLTAYVQNLYTGVQGENNIYYHNGTILDDDGNVIDAEDYSYRFAGADEHADYYTCTYDGEEVLNVGGYYEVNHSLKGDCSAIYLSTINDTEDPDFTSKHYVDKSVYNTGTSVMWDSENNKCVTNFGKQVYYFHDMDEFLLENECTGMAYKIRNEYVLMNLSLVGEGEETFYESSGGVDNNYVCFGSTETPCSYDNLYRIIGLIDGKIRLIKADVVKSNLLGTDGDYKSDFFSANYDDGDNVDYHIMAYKGKFNVDEVATYSWNYNNDV